MNLTFSKTLQFIVFCICLEATVSKAGFVNPVVSDLSQVNTAGGSFVLDENVTGLFNTGFGYGVLTTNNSGNNNTGVGAYALVNNSLGGFNTAIGRSALELNTAGIDNTAAGSNALMNNTTGFYNTAVGSHALFFNGLGTHNTANGYYALKSNTDGSFNNAEGSYALYFNTTGNNNVATGHTTLQSNTTGTANSAYGLGALFANTTGNNNTALGFQALKNKGAGNGNLALGMNAGINLKSGNGNIYLANAGIANESTTIRIGSTSHSKAFIGGISGKTTGLSSAVPVLIDSNGQLGTVKSSARYKQDIQDMNEASHNLLKLRPVTFHYKDSYEDGGKPLEYGLIAEEVAKVYPDLVAYGADGKVETVQYQKLTPMLLNEVQHLNNQNDKLVAAYQQQTKEIADLKQQMETLQAQAETLTKLAAQLSRLLASQTVVNLKP